ncbi:hypothetical protein AVEN_166971-1, partial [Araneus ventricosus]
MWEIGQNWCLAHDWISNPSRYPSLHLDCRAISNPSRYPSLHLDCLAISNPSRYPSLHLDCRAISTIWYPSTHLDCLAISTRRYSSLIWTGVPFQPVRDLSLQIGLPGHIQPVPVSIPPFSLPRPYQPVPVSTSIWTAGAISTKSHPYLHLDCRDISAVGIHYLHLDCRAISNPVPVSVPPFGLRAISSLISPSGIHPSILDCPGHIQPSVFILIWTGVPFNRRDHAQIGLPGHIQPVPVSIPLHLDCGPYQPVPVSPLHLDCRAAYPKAVPVSVPPFGLPGHIQPSVSVPHLVWAISACPGIRTLILDCRAISNLSRYPSLHLDCRTISNPSRHPSLHFGLPGTYLTVSIRTSILDFRAISSPSVSTPQGLDCRTYQRPGIRASFGLPVHINHPYIIPPFGLPGHIQPVPVSSPPFGLPGHKCVES